MAPLIKTYPAAWTARSSLADQDQAASQLLRTQSKIDPHLHLTGLERSHALTTHARNTGKRKDEPLTKASRKNTLLGLHRNLMGHPVEKNLDED